MAELRCPMCGKLNPDDLEVCLFCEARLTPLIGKTPSYPEYDDQTRSPAQGKRDQPEGIKPGDSPSDPGIKGSRGMEDRDSKQPVSSWLMSLSEKGEERNTYSKAASSAVNETEKEFREWLASLRNQTGSGNSRSFDSPDLEGTPVPHNEANETAEIQKQTSPVKEEADNSIPDWLSQLGAETRASVEEKSPSEENSSIEPSDEPEKKTQSETSRDPQKPEWLEVLETTSDEEEHLPEWLSQLPSIPLVETDYQYVNGSKGKQDKPSTTGQDSIENNEWLSQLKISLDDMTEPGASDETMQTRDRLEMGGSPDLRFGGKQPGGDSAMPSGSSPQEGGDYSQKPESILPTIETPDWLSSVGTDQTESEPHPDESKQAVLKTAPLPSWVQTLRPMESVISKPDKAGLEDQAEENRGPLAGLHGVIPSNPWLGKIQKSQADPIKLLVNNNQQRYAAQLGKMVMEEGQAISRKREAPGRSHIFRLALSFFLVAIILLPMLFHQTVLPDISLFPSEWEKTNQLINSIPAGKPILLATDYDPALASELEASAAPVINHFLLKGTHFALISTNPTGPALGDQFLISLGSSHPDIYTGHTNLGYLAGGLVGISFFANNPTEAKEFDGEGFPVWETKALEGITRLSDFAALIIMTDNSDTGRLWIEQTNTAIGDTPFLMILSAQAEPMIRPYLDAGQIQGLVTGLAGGKVYEQSYATPFQARVYWDSFGFGILSIVVFISIGSLVNVYKSMQTIKKA